MAQKNRVTNVNATLGAMSLFLYTFARAHEHEIG